MGGGEWRVCDRPIGNDGAAIKVLMVERRTNTTSYFQLLLNEAKVSDSSYSHKVRLGHPQTKFYEEQRVCEAFGPWTHSAHWVRFRLGLHKVRGFQPEYTLGRSARIHVVIPALWAQISLLTVWYQRETFPRADFWMFPTLVIVTLSCGFSNTSVDIRGRYWSGRLPLLPRDSSHPAIAPPLSTTAATLPTRVALILLYLRLFQPIYLQYP